MEILQFIFNYIVIPMLVFMYRMHIDIVRLKAQLEDYPSVKKTLLQIGKDIHHLVEIHKKEL